MPVVADIIWVASYMKNHKNAKVDSLHLHHDKRRSTKRNCYRSRWMLMTSVDHCSTTNSSRREIDTVTVIKMKVSSSLEPF